jgi:hypothetical protein
MRENEPAEDLITPNEVIETELGTPYEMRNRVQETGSETKDDRVEPVGDLVVTNVGTEDGQVEPVREANEEIVNEREVVLNVVANEGAQSFQVPRILDTEVLIEGTENFQVPSRVNSVPTRLSMQRKADATVIDKAKSINRNWHEVKIWVKSVTWRLAHEDRLHPFSVPEEEVGVNMADFRKMRKQDPFHGFSRIYSLELEEGSKYLMNIIDVTNEYVSARREGMTHSVPTASSASKGPKH